MDISGLLNYQTISPVRMMDCGTRGRGASFGELLSGARQTSAIHLYLPREGTIYSGGKGDQTVYAEYTAGSAAEDPVVLIKGEAASGAYAFICHINDIDLSRASYAELCALWGHLKAAGRSPIELGYPCACPLPYGVDVGDITVKQDYVRKIDAMTTSQVFDASNQRYARDLLELYLNWKDAG